MDFIPTTNQDEWNRDPLIGIISPTESVRLSTTGILLSKTEVGKAPHLTQVENKQIRLSNV